MKNTIVTHDAGSPRDELSPFWATQAPLTYIGWGKTTHLGYGLALAMGAKLANPKKLCVNFWGDAAIGMTGMDFETCVRCNIPILSILFNNFSMAMEFKIMKSSKDRFRSTDISGNYSEFAKALGGYGERVTEPGEIVNALKRGIKATKEGKPALLEFITTQEKVYSTFQGAGIQAAHDGSSVRRVCQGVDRREGGARTRSSSSSAPSSWRWWWLQASGSTSAWDVPASPCRCASMSMPCCSSAGPPCTWCRTCWPGLAALALHRRLGWLAVFWAPAMAVSAVYTTASNIHDGRFPPFFQPAFFLVANTLHILCFAGLVYAAVLMRRRTQWHRRLMFIAMATLTAAAFGRLIPMPLFVPFTIWATTLPSLVFPVAGAIRDLRRDGHVHPAWWWGIGYTIHCRVVIGLVANSALGLAFYEAVTSGSTSALPPYEFRSCRAGRARICSSGRVAERFKAPVLKTGGLTPTVGSTHPFRQPLAACVTGCASRPLSSSACFNVLASLPASSFAQKCMKYRRGVSSTM